MSSGNLSKAVKVARVLNAVAAGTTDQNGSVIDMQGFEVVTPPVIEPVTLAEAKAHLRLDTESDDGYV